MSIFDRFTKKQEAISDFSRELWDGSSWGPPSRRELTTSNMTLRIENGLIFVTEFARVNDFALLSYRYNNLIDVRNKIIILQPASTINVGSIGMTLIDDENRRNTIRKNNNVGNGFVWDTSEFNFSDLDLSMIDKLIFEFNFSSEALFLPLISQNIPSGGSGNFITINKCGY